MAVEKVKVSDIDIDEVNQISITKVASDWGIELYSSHKKNEMLAYCPNPDHNDQNLGSCYFIENGDRNFFYCFSCGAGGGPINLIMLIEQCNFQKALNKLAYKYGLVKYKHVDIKDLPPRWNGLSYEEYRRYFGLKNVSIKAPKGINQDGEVSFSSERITLRELAHSQPEVHDEILINKFIERVYNLLVLYNMINSGYIPEAEFPEEWEDVIITLVDKYKELLEKGLCNKERINDVFVDREKELERELEEEELKRAIAKDLLLQAN